jgi:hypothetical protein
MPWQPHYIKRYHECFETSTGVARVLTDAGEVFIKPLGNAVGPHALAREWIGTSIARYLELKTFDFAIMDVEADDDIPLGHNRQALPGPAFVTRKMNGFVWGGDMKQLEKVNDKGVFSRLVVLDTLILNQDRYPPSGSARKPNRDNIFLSERSDEKGRYDLFAFDHSDCLRAPADLSPLIKNISNTKDEKVYGLYPEFYGFITYETVNMVLTKLVDLAGSKIDSILNFIPDQWEINNDTKDALKVFLCERTTFLLGNIHRMISEIKGKLLV